MYGGIDPMTGKEIGKKTPDATAWQSFEDAERAFLLQLDYLADACMEIANAYEPYFATINPSSIYSATVTSSLENARDGYCNGVKFNNSSLPLSALASATDALLAIRYLVFEQKLVTVSALLQILRENWKGAEELRTLAWKCPLKYGTGNAEADGLFARLAAHYAAHVRGRANGRGGVYKPSLASARAFIWQGEKTIATPDGRFSGEETAKNASPTPGMDTKGVTALIRSATSFPQDAFTEGVTLDVMLNPAAVAGAEGLRAFRALLDVYLARGGMTIQFNVLDASILREAQLAPERYRNLQVRVAGWNALWNDISKKEQDAYILRAENIR
jgi:formate C-acetyltransferase